MTDEIVFLTPLGQLIRTKQKELGLGNHAMARAIGVDVEVFRSLFTKRASAVDPRMAIKLKRFFDMEVLPEYPEDLSPLDALIYKYRDDTKLRIPYIVYRSLRAVTCAMTVQQFVIRFACDLMVYIQKHCEGVMAVDLKTRVTALPECAVTLDLFTLHKPLTKISVVLTFDRSLNFLHVWLFEASQQDSTPVNILFEGQFNTKFLNLLMKKVLPRFCEGYKKSFTPPIDRLLKKKKRQHKYAPANCTITNSL